MLDAAAAEVAVRHLIPSDFILPINARTHATMLKLHQQGTAIDTVTVTEAMRSDLKDGQDLAYVSSLADHVPRLANAEHYARIVKEKSALRKIIHLAHDLEHSAYGGEINARAIAALTEAQDRKGAAQPLKALTAAELAAAVADPVQYLVYPIGTRGILTVVDGQPKTAGKTTLVLHAIAASRRREIFLARPTNECRVLFVSEENRRTFRIAVERAGLGKADGVFYLTLEDWAGIPWPSLAERIEKTCQDLRVDWLVLDTFYEIAGLGAEQEKDAGIVSAAVRPVRHMTGRLDVASTLTRHERKSGGDVGQSGRGSNALTGACDAVVQVTRLPASYKASMRQIELAGRVEVDSFKIELLGGRYVRHDTDVRVATVEEAEAINLSIQQDQAISEREIARLTGIDRHRISILAAKAGWTRRSTPKGSVWERIL
jgi:AAA domain/DnaB-like helicase N terminal domain